MHRKPNIYLNKYSNKEKTILNQFILLKNIKLFLMFLLGTKKYRHTLIKI